MVRSRLSTLERALTLANGRAGSLGATATGAVYYLRIVSQMRVKWFAPLILASCVTGPLRVATPEQLAAVAAPLQRIGPGDLFLIGAGDIADCGPQLAAARATAAIVQQFPTATVFTAGDNAYKRGRADEFADCYGPTWGAFRSRTRPAPGNHEHYTPEASGYAGYFGVPLYYSFDLGSWHIVSLDSMLDMAPASPQLDWLRHDLEGNTRPCIAAIWHHPRFSSGIHGRQRNDPGRHTDMVWSVLASHHAALIINGHDHDYERFAPRDGIRQIVVGTGGGELRPFVWRVRGSEHRDARHYGVLLLTLHQQSYDWHFITVDGVIGDASAAPQPCDGAKISSP
jgi:hypothetical protein